MILSIFEVALLQLKSATEEARYLCFEAELTRMALSGTKASCRR